MANFDDVLHEVEHDAELVQGYAREVVAKRTAIVGFVTTLLLVLANFSPGFDISGTVTHWLDVLFAVAGFVATIGVVRPAVTPVSDPRNNAGEKLVPVSAVKAALAKVEVHDPRPDVRPMHAGEPQQ